MYRHRILHQVFSFKVRFAVESLNHISGSPRGVGSEMNQESIRAIIKGRLDPNHAAHEAERFEDFLGAGS